MIGMPDGVRVHLAAGRTDLRRGIDGLAAQIQTVLQQDPFIPMASDRFCLADLASFVSIEAALSPCGGVRCRWRTELLSAPSGLLWYSQDGDTHARRSGAD